MTVLRQGLQPSTSHASWTWIHSKAFSLPYVESQTTCKYINYASLSKQGLRIGQTASGHILRHHWNRPWLDHKIDLDRDWINAKHHWNNSRTTLDQPQIDPGSTLDRPWIDPKSTQNRPGIDPEIGHMWWSMIDEKYQWSIITTYER